MQISPLRAQPDENRRWRLFLRGLAFVVAGLVVASCGTTTTTTQTNRVVPQSTEAPPAEDALVAPTAEPQVEPATQADDTEAADGDGETGETDETDESTEETETAASEPEAPRIRSFQEFLPDAASIEELYGDGGLWTLTDIRYLEPGPRVGLPCGDTEPPDFDGLEAIYSNVSGENLLVMVQQGEGVDIWIQGVAEGAECTELGIRQSALTVSGVDQSVVLEINPEAPAASMAVTGALQDDIFISFVAGAVSPDSPVASPAPLITLTEEMFDRINTAE